MTLDDTGSRLKSHGPPPGALVLAGSLELELTGSVFEFSRLSLVNGLGSGKDLTTTRQKLSVPSSSKVLR